MPRYSPIQERQSPKDKKLGQLAALAQLDEPRQRQQELASREHQQRVATAMQMLGLQQQQQNATAEQALRERALTQSGEQFGQQQQFAQQQADEKSGQFWGGTLPLQYTEQAGLESNRNAMQDHYKNADLISAAGAMTDPRVSSAILDEVPGVASAREKIAAEDMAAKLQAFKMQMEATKGTPAQATVIASMPPEIRQQLLGSLPTVAPTTSAVSGSPTTQPNPFAVATPTPVGGSRAPEVSDYWVPDTGPGSTSRSGSFQLLELLKDVYRNAKGEPILGPTPWRKPQQPEMQLPN